MMKANMQIRRLAGEKLIFQWQIADRLGVSEPTFYRWMRKELPEEKRKQVINAILDIEAEQKEGTKC